MFGVHVNKSRNKKVRTMSVAIKEEMKRLRDYGVKTPCAQIFVAGPRNYKLTVDAAEIARIRALGESITIHGAYVDKPWSGSDLAIDNIVGELKVAYDMGASGVVVHLGAASATDKFIPAVRSITDRASKVCVGGIAGGNAGATPLLWLEVQAAKPAPHTFETPQKLNALFERLDGIGGIGLCIDTAHLFSCGMSLQTHEAAEEFFTQLRCPVPMMIHLNDSASKLASGVDKHAAIGNGAIWSDDMSGLKYIIDYAIKNKIQMYFERHDDDVCKDLKVLSTLGYV